MALRRELQESNELLEQRVRAQVRAITSAQTATIFAMSRLAESRDPGAGGRLERLREYARVLARQLGTLPRYQSLIDDAFIDAIYAAAPLLDIGKVGIPDAVLLKAARLEPAEWEVMKAHTLIGGDMLRAVDREHPGNVFIRAGVEIAEGHHEKWDGSGYPRGTAGESIPLPARIVALADVYDGLTAPRGDKQGFTHDEARQVVADGAGRHFDPDVVDAFLRSEAEFARIRRRFAEPEPAAQPLAELGWE
jgi:putative two-component system response regulator